MLVDGARPADCITTARTNLDLLASNDSLLGAQPIIARRSDWSRTLDQALRTVSRQYDFTLIDVPGSLTIFSVNALMASDELLVPTTVEHLSIRGLAILFKQVDRITAGSTIVRMIVPTMYDPRLRQSALLLEQLQGTYGSLVGQPVRINVRLSESSFAGQTIYEFDAHSRGAVDYALLVKRLSELWGYPPSARASAEPAREAVTERRNGRAVVPSPAPPAPAPPIAAMPRPLTCPHCGGLLRRTITAGYRILSCDKCHYQEQELASGLHR